MSLRCTCLFKRQIKHKIGLMLGVGLLYSCDKGSTSWFHPDNLIASIAMMRVQYVPVAHGVGVVGWDAR